MDRLGNVNIFIGESAGMGAILEEMEKNGQAIPRDAFGHVKLDLINPGKWFGEQLAHRIGAEKVLVQKSGYFARSASPNGEDLALIGETARLAIESALCQKSGVVGCDGENLDRLSLVDFSRIRGGKPYNPSAPDFQKMLQEIGQSG
jgi:pyrophosphate--fructose-6-phosphate 1-phosphotransferase